MITIVSGTHRPKSYSLKTAKAYSYLLNELGEKSQILNMEDLPKNFIWDNMFGDNTREWEELVAKYIDGVSSIIFVLAEYNGTYPGITKVFLDALDPSKMKAKRVALVGIASGIFGNQRGLDDLTMVMHHLKADVIPRKVIIPEVYNCFNEKGYFENEKLKDRIKDQLAVLLS